MTTERTNRTTASQPVAGAAVGTGKPAACKRYRNPARGAAVVVCWPCSNATGRDTFVLRAQCTGGTSQRLTSVGRYLAGVVRERFGPVRDRQSAQQASRSVRALSQVCGCASSQRRNPSSISCVEPRSARVSQAGMVSGEIPERVRALLPMKHLLGAISGRPVSFLHDTLRAGW